MRLVIVTGMSGAGKSTALNVLEDAGYFCVDNLPIPLLSKFIEMFSAPDTQVDKGAVGIDIRGARSFGRLGADLDYLAEQKIPHEYLESPGEHNYGFWNQYLEPAVKWLLEE